MRHLNKLLPNTAPDTTETEFLIDCDSDGSKHTRMRYALLGDAILRLVAVDVFLKKHTTGSNGDVTLMLDQVLTNDGMRSFMNDAGIDTSGLDGKRCGDTFEAWIGYCSRHVSNTVAQNICVQYLKGRIWSIRDDPNSIYFAAIADSMSQKPSSYM